MKNNVTYIDRLRLWTQWLLCTLALVFPFSVAATSILLGLILTLGLVSTIWMAGIRTIWADFHSLALAMITYWGLMLVGLLWSPDRLWGLHVIGHQWFWLALPVVVSALSREQWKARFLTALSIGLTLHLVFCVFQKFGIVKIHDFGGSNAHDATGFIGHIGFGFIYGIWAGWLVHRGWDLTGRKRWLLWFLAIWSWLMIFAAQGRSGYVVAFAIIVVVAWKHLIGAGYKKGVITIVLLLTVIGILAMGPGKQRLMVTWQEITALQHGEVRKSDPRWSLWIAAVDAWKSHPVLGVGTGGFPLAAKAEKRIHPNLLFEGQIPVQPHDMYIFSLARWGLFGLFVYISLVVIWIRTGWRLKWDRLQSPLMAFSGIALALDGLFSPTIEQQGTGIMLVMMLGIELARRNTN